MMLVVLVMVVLVMAGLCGQEMVVGMVLVVLLVIERFFWPGDGGGIGDGDW